MMIYPLKKNWISYPFINNKKDLNDKYTYLHYGIDEGHFKGMDPHLPIYAVEDGVVIYNRYQSSGGYVIHIRHDNGFVSEYGHLQKDSQKVLEGDVVKKGQQIANMGDSGNCKGIHLHFGLYKGSYIDYNNVSNFVNPIDYLYLADWQEVDPYTDKQYKILRESDYNEYTTGIYECNYIMYLRSEPTRYSKPLKIKNLTKEQKEACTKSNPEDDALYKQGTNFTAKEIIKNEQGEYWARTYRNAYICIDDGTTKYCSKVN